MIVSLAVERIRGEYLESFSSADMRRGKELEEEARQAYERKRGVLIIEEPFIVHPELPFVGVSPDGLVGDDGMIELKCYNVLYKHADALLYGDNAEEHHWQTQTQMWAARRKWCDVNSFDPRYPKELQLAITRVYPVEDDWAKLDAECRAAEVEIQFYLNELTKLKEIA